MVRASSSPSAGPIGTIHLAILSQTAKEPRPSAGLKRRIMSVGWDLAHAAGNLPLRLHEWNADFAAWCSYKYLNAGPGAVAGCFVHERHLADTSLPRFGGWWGNDPATRFRMHLQPEFLPRKSADGWQLSNPPIFAMAALKTSLQIFDEAGMAELRAKSKRLTGYLEFLLNSKSSLDVELITPAESAQRGCQLSIRLCKNARSVADALADEGVVVDVREPDVIRVAPTPLYNRFSDVRRFHDVFSRAMGGQ